MLFESGQLVATPGALNHLAVNDSSALELIRRHLQGDWGDLCTGDRKLNYEAAIGGERILSAYTIADLKVYVITEWNRSYTTVLLASEH